MTLGALGQPSQGGAACYASTGLEPLRSGLGQSLGAVACWKGRRHGAQRVGKEIAELKGPRKPRGRLQTFDQDARQDQDAAGRPNLARR